MADAAANVLANNVNSLEINGVDKTEDVKKDRFEDKWGFPLPELYKIALTFYKEKEGKAIHLSYQDKLKLVAYTKQVAHGKYRPDVSPDVGLLDVVGSDRRQAWQSLGDMSKTSAMGEFVRLLHLICPQFPPYIQAHQWEKEESIRKQKEEVEHQRMQAEEQERQKLEEAAHKHQEVERQRQTEQELQIRSALNQQTLQQFHQYAEQQFPGNPQQQQELMTQLQEQHYQQYMQQVYQQQLAQQQQQQQYQQLQNVAGSMPQNPLTAPTTQNGTVPNKPASQPNGPVSPGGQDSTNEQALRDEELPLIAAASMWTRKDTKEFKDSLHKDKDSVIKIGSGETVTVRVPTHEDGNCLFWEFSTDYYDLGFGVYFEWTIAPNNTVSVHVSESSDEEEGGEEEEENVKSDIEKGSKKEDRPPTDEIIPVYRRDSHEEVYCGSHAYPGRGVYLLKFDNSYSLWRSKTLYYRVYYSR
ncbi:hypothetical protein ScPMuIL_013822 [Solemya velum]